jgi:hypothetical protein
MTAAKTTLPRAVGSAHVSCADRAVPARQTFRSRRQLVRSGVPESSRGCNIVASTRDAFLSGQNVALGESSGRLRRSSSETGKFTSTPEQSHDTVDRDEATYKCPFCSRS